MNLTNEDLLKYPIGKFSPVESYGLPQFQQDLSRILRIASKLRDAVQDLNQDQLNTPYRDGGWNIRQVVHHLADSHMNAYIRTKWALTEDCPIIKAYQEKDWAMTPENETNPEISIALIEAIHLKWVELLKRIPFEALQKSFIHPASQREMNLERIVQMYAWHGEHHLSHISGLKKRMGW